MENLIKQLELLYKSKGIPESILEYIARKMIDQFYTPASSARLFDRSRTDLEPIYRLL